MAVNINNTPYSNFAARSVNERTRQREAGNRARGVEAKEQAQDVNQPKLSKAAQELLERLKSTYSNMDFMVADYSGDEEAQSILSRGTKDFSVLLSTEELEKMAADEDYAKANEEKIQSAVSMSEEISKRYSEDSDKDGGNGVLTRVGISFNNDGTVSYFAELENLSTQQKERIEKQQEEKAEEKKAAQQEEARKGFRIPVKKTTVQASSQEELLEKIGQLDWSKVHATGQTEGARFDFSI